MRFPVTYMSSTNIKFPVSPFQGCKDRSLCSRIEDINGVRYCDRRPSQCTYCCDDREKCNDFNTASTNRDTKLWKYISFYGIIFLSAVIKEYISTYL